MDMKLPQSHITPPKSPVLLIPLIHITVLFIMDCASIS